MNKHPGPWKYDDDWGAIRDANGERIVTAEPIGESNSSVLFDDDKVKRLILAAPELLEALRECIAAIREECQEGGKPIYDAVIDADGLIEWIERGDEP